jgi:hypothetical protein
MPGSTSETRLPRTEDEERSALPVSFGNQPGTRALSLAGSSRFRDLLPAESGQGQIRRMFRITSVRGTGREPRGDDFAALSALGPRA